MSASLHKTLLYSILQQFLLIIHRGMPLLRQVPVMRRHLEARIVHHAREPGALRDTLDVGDGRLGAEYVAESDAGIHHVE